MSDHKAEAESLAAGTKTGYASNATTMATTALVHATLYLAEQQRIANLIAYRTVQMYRNGDTATVEQGMFVEHRAEINEGLGLA